jgi:hypothetical protein
MPADSPDLGWEEKRVLIIGRASPEPSLKHIETVCTGGITEDGQLLRLYPISLRYLEEEKRYKLWSWARFDVSKNPQDKRKESYRVREESITVLAEVRSWSERFSLLKRGIFPDRETLELRYREDWTSMGVIEIEYLDLQQRVRQKDWERDKPYIKQFHLYTETKPLEQLPLDMRLRFRCKNNPRCKTHVSTLIGWEYMEAFRKFRTKYGTGHGAFSQIKAALEERFADPKRDAFALMGTHFKYSSWMVAQLYFFEKSLPSRLF